MQIQIYIKANLTDSKTAFVLEELAKEEGLEVGMELDSWLLKEWKDYNRNKTCIEKRTKVTNFEVLQYHKNIYTPIIIFNDTLSLPIIGFKQFKEQ